MILPPIRGLADREALWQALLDGTLQCVSSDHCAYGFKQKQPGFQDFRAMPGGAPGLDARVPIIWNAGVSTSRMTPLEFARVTALEPARTFGLYPRKGVVQIGSDADLVVMDADRTWTWPAFRTGWGSNWDPYAGIEGRGAPTLTMVRGRIVARDGTFLGDYDGRFLARTVDSSCWEDPS